MNLNFEILQYFVMRKVVKRKDFDTILCVVSSREKQIERMTAKRGYSREEAEARLSAQMDAEEKASRSHYAIRNDGTPDELKAEAEKLARWLAR